MNESYHISRFRSLHEFTKNLPFLWHLLNCKLPKTGRKLKQSLEVHMLTRELCVFTKKDHSVFRSTCRQVVYEMSFVCIQRSFLVKKMISPVIIIWHRAFIQTVKCSLLDKKIVYQSFYGALLLFSYFLLQGKVLCFARVGKLCAICLLSKGPVIRATFFFNLSCNIVAVQVETRCCAYYHLRDQLVPQQNILLQISGVLRLWLVSRV